MLKLWCWRRLLRMPWTARRSNKSILKEMSPEYSLEGLRLKLKLQYFGHLMEELTHWKIPWPWERLRARRERGWPKNRRLDGITASVDMSLSKLRETWRTRKPCVLQFMGLQRVRHDWATEQQQMFKLKLNYKILIMFVRTQSIWNIRFSERCKEKRKEGCEMHRIHFNMHLESIILNQTLSLIWNHNDNIKPQIWPI